MIGPSTGRENESRESQVFENGPGADGVFGRFGGSGQL